MKQENNPFDSAPLMSDTLFRKAENKDTRPSSNREFWKDLAMVIIVLLFIIIVVTYYFPLSNLPSTYP